MEKTSMKNVVKAQIALAAAAAMVFFGHKLTAQDAPATQPAKEAATQPSAPPVLSEDFETGEINKDIWDVRVTGTATAKVQQDKAAHGKSALQIHYPAGNKGYAFIVATHLPDSVRQHFFGRASVYASPNPPNAHDVAILAGTPGWPVSNFLELGLHDTHLQPSFQENGANVPRGETIHRSKSTYPQGKWFCLEWEFNDNPDHMNIWIDGTQVGNESFSYKTGGSSNLVKGFSDFAFGFRAWGAGAKTDFDLYYDDIAIGTGRIGPVSN
jgi:hypothetical protein